MKLKQQFLEVDIRDRELETIFDYLNSKEDEITALKNILIETDEAGMDIEIIISHQTTPIERHLHKTVGRLTFAPSFLCARTELTYAYEMERCQKLRRETKELALQAAQSCKRYVEGNAFAVSVFFCCFFYLLTHCSSRRAMCSQAGADRAPVGHGPRGS